MTAPKSIRVTVSATVPNKPKSSPSKTKPTRILYATISIDETQLALAEQLDTTTATRSLPDILREKITEGVADYLHQVELLQEISTLTHELHGSLDDLHTFLKTLKEKAQRLDDWQAYLSAWDDPNPERPSDPSSLERDPAIPWPPTDSTESNLEKS